MKDEVGIGRDLSVLKDELGAGRDLSILKVKRLRKISK